MSEINPNSVISSFNNSELNQSQERDSSALCDSKIRKSQEKSKISRGSTSKSPSISSILSEQQSPRGKKSKNSSISYSSILSNHSDSNSHNSDINDQDKSTSENTGNNINIPASASSFLRKIGEISSSSIGSDSLDSDSNASSTNTSMQDSKKTPQISEINKPKKPSKKSEIDMSSIELSDSDHDILSILSSSLRKTNDTTIDVPEDTIKTDKRSNTDKEDILSSFDESPSEPKQENPKTKTNHSILSDSGSEYSPPVKDKADPDDSNASLSELSEIISTSFAKSPRPTKTGDRDSLSDKDDYLTISSTSGIQGNSVLSGSLPKSSHEKDQPHADNSKEKKRNSREESSDFYQKDKNIKFETPPVQKTELKKFSPQSNSSGKSSNSPVSGMFIEDENGNLLNGKSKNKTPKKDAIHLSSDSMSDFTIPDLKNKSRSPTESSTYSPESQKSDQNKDTNKERDWSDVLSSDNSFMNNRSSQEKSPSSNEEVSSDLSESDHSNSTVNSDDMIENFVSALSAQDSSFEKIGNKISSPDSDERNSSVLSNNSLFNDSIPENVSEVEAKIAKSKNHKKNKTKGDKHDESVGNSILSGDFSKSAKTHDSSESNSILSGFVTEENKTPSKQNNTNKSETETNSILSGFGTEELNSSQKIGKDKKNETESASNSILSGFGTEEINSPTKTDKSQSRINKVSSERKNNKSDSETNSVLSSFISEKSKPQKHSHQKKENDNSSSSESNSILSSFSKDLEKTEEKIDKSIDQDSSSFTSVNSNIISPTKSKQKQDSSSDSTIDQSIISISSSIVNKEKNKEHSIFLSSDNENKDYSSSFVEIDSNIMSQNKPNNTVTSTSYIDIDSSGTNKKQNKVQTESSFIEIESSSLSQANKTNKKQQPNNVQTESSFIDIESSSVSVQNKGRVSKNDVDADSSFIDIESSTVKPSNAVESSDFIETIDSVSSKSKNSFESSFVDKSSEKTENSSDFVEIASSGYEQKLSSIIVESSQYPIDVTNKVQQESESFIIEESKDIVHGSFSDDFEGTKESHQKNTFDSSDFETWEDSGGSRKAHTVTKPPSSDFDSFSSSRKGKFNGVFVENDYVKHVSIQDMKIDKVHHEYIDNKIPQKRLHKEDEVQFSMPPAKEQKLSYKSIETNVFDPLVLSSARVFDVNSQYRRVLSSAGERTALLHQSLESFLDTRRSRSKKKISRGVTLQDVESEIEERIKNKDKKKGRFIY
ncbi:hypothetical protein TVAG_206950 [Trichomonas vaginalis G3]|uniref:Uncharacterized protein n=1 Tax=Trichomonas vaginalis (strain ATCC PRA-98 / G3) TaxID=412133 RepID=A2EY73_TRIV3|nr:hypothetical protein TVAGG3_0413770 [Trichomonas vaginalis G3]EAY02419.1 hypothetical protein TVAG_206950 [Trichomonas vaginalis G3]KAI5535539.1 hypothetical protein TVAGG3_0413770 [Trichomonas vaginalis G3]|eukprot:XP_001330672.1 hypothetical protein [Trichomonas vaginalis G3]